ncbi:peptidase domain-containing ABC transporter (plasmid) [Clostridium estertheticum]|uniref:Peptidase domain-containing ABC transporter n=1 Tax=Clostridium estertheticum TaxID=238834 RepID=A0AA47ERD3_9CLOT|nr:peptidase domain-containing ABC transporter [Clostridium estertheticum]MBU3157720.1 peptidase domain-containing ABC transporter [Clostridium estertheticum]MBU3201975.1 peptidase domain-containing ABC transporter [Clostridium estertheticum]WAG63348.1 peptidase domain-containing ABC transporter [Clostridium estertheticum]WAG68218.1 peptidase domain-containing ABC transporter [Clostridium estertheticum]
MIKILKCKIPFIKQTTNTECGSACLTMILNYYGNHVEIHKISEECGMNRNGITIKTLKKVAKDYGLDCKAYKINSLNSLNDLNHDIILPSIVLIRENHFIILENIVNKRYFIIDPNGGRKILNEEDMKKVFLGFLVVLKPNNTFIQNKNKNKWNTMVETLRKQKSNLCYITILSLVIQMFILCIPFIIQHLIDNIILKQTINIVNRISILNLTIITVYGIVSYIRKQYIIKFQTILYGDITKEFIKKFLNLPMNFFELRATKDLKTLLNNINIISENISNFVTTMIPDTFMIFILMVIMITKSIKLSLIVIFLAIMKYTLFYLASKKLKNKCGGFEGNIQSYLVECLNRINLIKYTGMEENIFASCNNIFNNDIKMSNKKSKIKSFIESTTVSIRITMPIVILCFGVSDVIKGTLSIGSLLGFILIVIIFLCTMESLVSNIQKIRISRSIIDKFDEVMNYKEYEQNTHKEKIETIKTLEFEKVYFSYNKFSDSILKNISFKFNEGEKVAIIGATGAGKTTLTKLILGFYKANSGNIKINGIDINSLNMTTLRRNIGIVLQESYFFNDTIRNNIDISGNLQLEDIRNAAKKVCIDDEFMRLPLKYNTFIGEAGKNISGGQRKRIAIARALVNKPSIVIFDEALSELGEVTEKQICENLNNLKITQVFITQKLSTIKDADKIIVMDNGEIIKEITYEKLISKNAYCKSYKSEQ